MNAHFRFLPKLSLWVGLTLLNAGALASAQAAYRFDAATVSGLPARNIGSATMSGRIAALDAIEQDGRITVFVGAASGGVWKSVNGGTTYKPVAGVMYPFSVATGSKSNPGSETFTVERVEVNVPVDNADFALPTSLKQAPKPEAK
jgi:hypothetical protein